MKARTIFPERRKLFSPREVRISQVVFAVYANR